MRYPEKHLNGNCIMMKYLQILRTSLMAKPVSLLYIITVPTRREREFINRFY